MILPHSLNRLLHGKLYLINVSLVSFESSLCWESKNYHLFRTKSFRSKPNFIPNVNFKSIFSVQSPSDPLYPYQWYLRNDGQSQGKPRLDLNVEKAWALGYTGKNITTAIMDDGVDYMHPDLRFNFNAEASYDFSSNDPYPYPRYTDDW